jgi:phosphotransferase system  glucose/maltose/N-acetylglucosamine-specific IIC component
MLQKVMENLPLILAVLLGISEALAMIPALKANGILDGVIKALKALGAKKDASPMEHPESHS